MPLTPAMDSLRGGQRRHPFLALSLAALAIMVVVVLITKTGIDVLIILALLTALFVVERLLSDWFADVLGPKLGLGLLAALLFGLGIWGTSDAAPRKVRSFVSSPLSTLVGHAEGYGYTGAFISGARPVLSPLRGSLADRGVPSAVRSGRDGSGMTARSADNGIAPAVPSAVTSGDDGGLKLKEPTEPSVELKVVPAAPAAGEPARIVVTLRSRLGRVAGEIAVDVNRIEAGRLRAPDGLAAWTTTFPSGRFRLQARYLGSETFAPSRSAPLIVRVRTPQPTPSHVDSK